MNRRRFVSAVAFGQLASASLLAGCTSGDQSSGTPNQATTSERATDPSEASTTDRPPSPSEPPEPTEESETGASPGQSVELAAFDSQSVAEAYTLLVTGTIANTAREDRTVLFVGEIHVEDGDTYTGRRLVDVPGETGRDTRVKVRVADAGSFFYYDHDAEVVPDPDVTQDELRLPDDAHDLVVVESDATASDGRIDVTAQVENRSFGTRSATLNRGCGSPADRSTRTPGRLRFQAARA